MVAVGKLRDRALETLCADYQERIAHYGPFEVVEVRDDAALERALDARARVVALDAGGVAESSEGFARWLEKQQVQGGAPLSFVIGGADGLPPAVRARAARVLSLGPMTLPHKLARLILLEQIYRALTIIKGEPYHK